jgi:predicted secreted protein with PEFG-CTERM motif
MTSLTIVFLAVSIISVSALSQNAYAAAGMSLSADGSGDSIAVSGTSDRSDQDVSILVWASNGNLVSVAQSSVSGGSFSASVNVSNYSDGTYTIAASQGDASNYNLSVDVDVMGGSSDSSVSATSSTAADVTVEEVDSSAVVIHGLTITADAIEGATTIDVSGTTDRNGEIVLTVTAPNGNIVSIDQVTPSGDSYMTTISVGGALWSQDGMYTISAQQGDASNYKTSTQVDIKDGHVVPEFGTIAIMILVVAIVSIIALSAKTKLSLVPRY